jgi:ferric-dicitrate binding protein FerR (iron transport regulator)
MNSPAPELEELLNALADGLLDETGEARLAELLRTDPHARRHYRQFMALHSALLGDYAIAAASASETSVPLPVPRRPWPAVWALAAAVALLLGGIAVWFAGREARPAPVVTLAAVAGVVSWSDAANVPRASLQAGDRLSAGAVKVESESGSARLRFADGTELTLTGASELAFADDGQKRIVLREGALLARVPVQRHGLPLVVRTATAEVQATDAVCSLSASAGLTEVNVERGQVRFRRLTDGRTVNVAEHQTASVSLDPKPEIALHVPAGPPSVWRQQFQSPPPEAWKGEWAPARAGELAHLGAVPYRVGRADRPESEVQYGIKVCDDVTHLVSITSRSLLTVRFRTSRPVALWIFINLKLANGDFAGNFQTVVHPPEIVAGTDGWSRVEVPFSRLQPASPFPALPDGAQAAAILITTFTQQANLQVAELGIEPGRKNQ